MRVDQIGAAPVDVDLRTQVLERHRRALDMPAGPAHAPGTFPARFAKGAYLPEDEIERILLSRVIWICPSLRGQRHPRPPAQPAQPTAIGDAPPPDIADT